MCYSGRKVYQKLTPGEADELRVEVKAILKETPPPRHNLTKEEQKAIGKLKRDKTRVILTANKGVSLVVMDKEQYVTKAEELLNQPTYMTIQSDPTTKYKNELISLLKSIKTESGMSEALYRRLYPTGVAPWGEVPISCQQHSDFIEQIKDIKLKEDQCMVSHDVKALFTSVPIQPALNTIQSLLEDDKELHQRTTMSVKNIIILLEFCLKTHILPSKAGTMNSKKGLQWALQ